MKPDDEVAAASPRPLDSYADIAAELERIAEMVRDTPGLNHHAAERLLQIAREHSVGCEPLGWAGRW
jgi:hypothetical protein